MLKIQNKFAENKLVLLGFELPFANADSPEVAVRICSAK